MALPADGKGSSLNQNQDIMIHMNTCDPGYHVSLPTLHTK